MPELTLLRRGSDLSDPCEQLRILQAVPEVPDFADRVAGSQGSRLRASRLQILQVNVGKLCNQTCRHCHVDAGPDRRESMTREVAADCIAALRDGPFEILDVTGGAPEMNPQFRWLVEQARQFGVHVIDRSNLTILEAAGFRDLPEFLANHRVEVIASLPCYLEENTDRQRGAGVFARSVKALQRLNEMGYGEPETGLQLNLVFNPIGPSLPPPQAELETAYRRELSRRYGVRFNRLFTITNLPISRFLEDLRQQGRIEEYLRRLVDAFNPAAIEGLMCRHMISVDWEGRLYDCDFNQMLELPTVEGQPRTIREFNARRLTDREIRTDRHCYGCTAGAGSSCNGALT